MTGLTMEIRAVDADERTLAGVVAPYDEVSYLTKFGPTGERILRGAFSRSIEQRGAKVRLFVGHAHVGPAVGHALEWSDGPDGLTGRFRFAPGRAADDALEQARADLFGGLSVGFRALSAGRGKDGVREVREARLEEVSLVGVPSYAGAEITEVRSAELDADALLAPFLTPAPVVDLSAFDAPWLL